MDEEAVILGRFFRISGFLGILLLASLGFLDHRSMLLTVESFTSQILQVTAYDHDSLLINRQGH
jgi:hypothetical protein